MITSNENLKASKLTAQKERWSWWMTQDEIGNWLNTGSLDGDQNTHRG